MAGAATDFFVAPGSAFGCAFIRSAFFPGKVAGGDLVWAGGIIMGAPLLTTGMAALAIGVAGG